MGADNQAQRVLDGKLAKAMRELINRAALENGSDTPDWILANYLLACLDAFDSAVRQRETFYGRVAQKTLAPENDIPRD